MPKHISKAHNYPEVGVPLFWPMSLALMPMSFALGAEEAAADIGKRTLDFLAEVEKTQVERPRPEWATPNHILLDLHTLTLRDFSTDPDQPPVLVVPPYAGHTSTIADFHAGQSLVATLRENGCPRLFAIDWRSATPQMRFYDVDNYLAEINVCVDELGGSVALVGLCQGGWCATMYAARYPTKVSSLVIAGAPIDTNAGDGAIKHAAHTLPMRFYEDLVRTGDGLLKGAYMLEGFKNMHPVTQYLEKFVELYEHVEDPSYVARFEQFERWYEYTINLPGAWYLQVIRQLFKENRLAKGEFVGLGRRLSLKDIHCPVFLLAGESDDITTKEQVFDAAKHLGTAKGRIESRLVPGGHVGLFMGTRTLRKTWPQIGRWIAASLAPS